MSIPNPVLTTQVTLGTTITSLAKTQDGVYAYINPTGNVPTSLYMKAASVDSSRSSIRLVLRRNPGLYDASSAAKSGNMSATFELAATKGSVVTADVLQEFVSELGSLLSNPALIDALLAGSLE